MSWAVHGWAAALTVALWWGATGLIAALVSRPAHSYPRLRWAASVAAVAAIATLFAVRDSTSAFDAATGFVAAIVVWGWIEVTFLTGLITGPRRGPGSLPVGEWRRAGAAFMAILWHEAAIVGVIAIVAALTLGHPNAVGLAALVVLWVMRTSAKLNLFLGVRNLGEGFLPSHLAHLLPFLRRRPMNPLLPVSVLAGGALAWWFTARAADGAEPLEASGCAMLATLAWLGVFEHLLMVLPLQPETLWRRAAVPSSRPEAAEPIGEQRP